MTKKLAALLALVMVVVMGCAVATSNSAASSASVSGTAYILSTSNNVVVASASHNTEGVTLSATLEEFQMPIAWAAVQKLDVTPTGTTPARYDYYLYNKYVGGYTATSAQTTPSDGKTVTLTAATTATLAAATTVTSVTAGTTASAAAGATVTLTAGTMVTLAAATPTGPLAAATAGSLAAATGSLTAAAGSLTAGTAVTLPAGTAVTLAATTVAATGPWVSAGGVYYPQYIQIGTKVFTFQAASTTYASPDGVVLPSVNLTVADRADYAQKMSQGWYAILNSSTPGDYMTGLNYTYTATATVTATTGTSAASAITGATRANRWERSFNTAWAAQMNNAVKFVKGRILTSLDADTLLSTDPATVATIVTVKNGIWYVGNDATGVANAPWAFPTYLGAFVTAYNGGNTTSTTSGGVTGGNGTTGGTDATSGATS